MTPLQTFAWVIGILIQGVGADYQLKLFDALGLNQTSVENFPGIELAYGPTKSESSFRFGTRTSDLKINHENTKSAIDKMNRYDDVTLAFTFKLQKTAKRKTGTLMAVSSPNTLRKYLSLTLTLSDSYVTDAEGMNPRRQFSAVLRLDYDSNGLAVTENITLGRNSTMRYWVKGMFRLKNKRFVTVYVNCKPIVQQQLKYPVSNIPGDAELRITQSCEASIWTGNLEITKRLLASVSRAELLFGSNSFLTYSQCSNIQSAIKQGDGEKSAESLKFHMSGSPSCSHGGSTYSNGEVFYLSSDPCQRCVCHQNSRVTCSKIVCPKLTCRYGTYDGAGCCPICRETKCSQERKVLTFGCKRKCSDKNYNTPCKKKRFGCYCPRGIVENEEGKCVKPSDCTCTVKEHGKTKTFKANTVVALSRCRYCTCNHSKVQCLMYC